MASRRHSGSSASAAGFRPKGPTCRTPLWRSRFPCCCGSHGRTPQESRWRDGALTAWIAGPDNKAVQRKLEANGTHANAWIVTAGLEPGDQLIIDGLSNLREGADVAPVPVTIDANGVVRDVAPADTGSADPKAAAGSE